MPIPDLTNLVTHRIRRLLLPENVIADEPPLRSELFSSEQLQRHAVVVHWEPPKNP